MVGSAPLAFRLSLFTGKGGVGKSTLVAALAVEAARRGLRPLVVELGHRATMRAIFGVEEIGPTPTEVAPGVHALNIEFEQSLSAYLQRHLPVAALARRIALRPSLGRFFQAAPAVGEILTMDRLTSLLGAGPEDAPAHHPILVDFDATGHALMFLGLPKVFEDLVPNGPLRRVLDDFARVLRDPDRTRLHLVTLPGRLPVQETLELHARLRREFPAVPVGRLFVNQVPDRPLSPELDGALAEARAASAEGDPDREDLELLHRALAQHREMEAELSRLADLGRPQVRLPKLPRAAIDGTQLALLGRLAAGEAT